VNGEVETCGEESQTEILNAHFAYKPEKISMRVPSSDVDYSGLEHDVRA